MLASDLQFNEQYSRKQQKCCYMINLTCIPPHSSVSSATVWTQLICLPVLRCLHLCLGLHIIVWVQFIVCNILLRVKSVCVCVRETVSLCVWGAWWRDTFGGLLIYTALCPISSIRMWENKACTFPQPRACRENTHHN